MIFLNDSYVETLKNSKIQKNWEEFFKKTITEDLEGFPEMNYKLVKETTNSETQFKHLEINLEIRKEILDAFYQKELKLIANHLAYYVTEILEKMVKWIKNQFNNISAVSLLASLSYDKELLEKIIYNILIDGIRPIEDLILKFPRAKYFRKTLLNVYPSRCAPYFLNLFNNFGSDGMINFIANGTYEPINDMKSYDFKKLKFSEEATNTEKIRQEIQEDFDCFKKMMMNYVFHHPSLFSFLSQRIETLKFYFIEGLPKLRDAVVMQHFKK
jgi:hypothetical protein